MARLRFPVLVAALVLAGCSGAGHPRSAAITVPATTSTAPSPTSSTSSTTPSTSTAPTTAPTAPVTVSGLPPRAVTITDTDTGSTVTVARGSTVTLVLHSTYWTVDPSSAPSVLAERGSPVVSPAPPGSGCVPGQGCGTVTAHFAAVGSGSATVSAHRSSCGEAMACSPAQSSYRVLFHIT